MAIDLETKQVLEAALEILETQMVYARNLHRSHMALYSVLLRDYPDLQKSHPVEMAKPQVFPEQDELIERIRSLIRRLKA